MQNSPNIWKWIKHRLSVQGLNFNKLATLYKVNRTCFTNLKNQPCPKYERITANLLEVEPWDIWPGRYDAEHNPNRVSSRYQGHKKFSTGNMRDGK